MTYSFLELLIFLEFISHCIKEILCKYKLQSWNKKKEKYIFHLFLVLMLKDLDFLCGVKIPCQQFLVFLGFMNIFWSSRSWMFFIIGALKNFALFWIKKTLQHRCFPVSIVKFLRTGYFQNFSSCWLCIILKVIKQLFCKGYFWRNALVMTS